MECNPTLADPEPSKKLAPTADGSVISPRQILFNLVHKPALLGPHTIYISHVSHDWDKKATRGTLNRKGYSLRWWQGLEAAGHIASKVWKQKAVNARAQLGPRPVEWTYPQSGWVFLLQMTQYKNSLTEMLQGLATR